MRKAASRTSSLAWHGHLLPTATILAVGAAPAFAGPNGESIIAGDVTFIHDGNQTIIQASDGSIIEYISFDVMPWQTIQFVQPHDLARVLNRITGGEPTNIDGSILANGFVYFINPAGVVFGDGAVVDAAGVIASAGQLSNSDFLSGNDRFTNLSGDVVNNGTITADAIHLLGKYVENAGLLESPGGIVTMVAGNTVHIQKIGERISVKVDGKNIVDRMTPFGTSLPGSIATNAGVVNSGTINAEGGQVVLGAGDLYSFAVNNNGFIRVADGRLDIAGTAGVVENSGLLDASVGSGSAGFIRVSAPAVVNTGLIRANSGSGTAGTIDLQGGQYMIIQPSGRVEARGGAGNAMGGTITINSPSGTTFIAAGSTLDVRGGTTGGNGGAIFVGGNSIGFGGKRTAHAQQRRDGGRSAARQWHRCHDRR